MKTANYAFALGKMAKMLLAPVGPLQYLLNTPGVAHIYSLEDAYRILEGDSKQKVADFFQRYTVYLEKGLLWADRGWKNVCHYYSRPGKQGGVRWPGAAAECQYYYNKAIFLSYKDILKGMFFVGAALHLVQDMCVPHHSLGSVFDGHQEFEKWATNHWDQFRTKAYTGIYPSFSHPAQWIDYNSEQASPLYSLVSLDKGCTSETYTEAANRLIPLTIATSAGFLDFVYQNLRNCSLNQ